MLSAPHYTGTPPLHQHPASLSHSHHPPPVQVSSAHSFHAHNHFAQQQQHGISALLPTPPSSPPAVGLHPVENTISLLESLVAFYHQERMWVYRTRAQLEMDMMQRAEEAAAHDVVPLAGEPEDSTCSGSMSPQSATKASPQSQGDPQGSQQPNGASPEGTSPSPPTKWLKRKRAFNLRLEGISTSRGGIPKHRPYPPHRPRLGSSLNPAGPQPGPTPLGPPPPHAFYPPPGSSSALGPATTTLTSPYLCHPSFAATFGPPPMQPSTPTTSQPSSYPKAPTSAHPDSSQAAVPFVLGAGGREPSVQILEMFEKMMQARMESCERVTRMVRSATSPGGPSGPNTGAMPVGGPVGAPGLAMNMAAVGGPVGGPGVGGPVGLNMNGTHDTPMGPIGVVPNGGAYTPGMMQGNVYAAQNMGQPQEQSQPQGMQDFPMGVGMG
ncbi:hypothetical protein ID866_2397 [Astraeus odoratus]|nr:hypothetical protein ID866_2397 [Astraeus odoratus]